MGIVLVLPADAALKLTAAFPADQYYVPPVETIRTETARPRGGQFNLIHEDSGYTKRL